MKKIIIGNPIDLESIESNPNETLEIIKKRRCR